MKIKLVTLTGADDNTDPLDLIDLSNKYPFVEWAILFSEKKTGSSRYPSKSWINNLYRISNKKLNLSAHFCGNLVTECLNYGTNIYLQNQEFNYSFARVQLNLGGRIKEINSYANNLIKISKTKKLILGGNYNYISDTSLFVKEKNILPLYDESGGKGIKTTIWKKPFNENIFTGYAGGLGPDNIINELNKINEVVQNNDIWIDMESNIRTDDKLDLNKCENILKLVTDYIKL